MPSTDSSSWLCRDERDRERLLDMDERLTSVRMISMAALAVALVLTASWLGWWTLLPLIGSAVGFAVAHRFLDRVSRPEYLVAAAWLLAELAIAGSVALTGGPRSPAVAWLVIPVVTLSARFNGRGVASGVVVVAAAILATTVGVDPSWSLHHPAQVLFPLALLVAVGVLSTALMVSDREYRNQALIDPLTSMLNRNALNARVAELAQQAAVVRQPIGVIVGDIDRFKSVNDERGHDAGDAVLRDIAYTLRKSLRAYDLAYRLGGEEFLILVPGGDLPASEQIAQKLRAVVEADPIAGLHITMSFGVSAAAEGAFDYDVCFTAADAALYRAKADGRNRVRTSGDPLPEAGAPDAEPAARPLATA